MNGLEAIKFMEQGNKVISKDGYVYMKSGDGIYEGKVESDIMGEINFFCLTKEYEEYIEPKQLTGWERVDDGDKFNSISSNGIFVATELNYIGDIKQYENANYFSTREKAEEINFKQTLFRKLQRFSDENGGNEINWSDDTEAKYSILYKHLSNDFCIDMVWHYQHSGIVYFASRDIAEKAVELFHDDLIKYFTHDWSKDEWLCLL